MRRLIAPAVAAALLLAGCGQSDYSEHTFKSVEDLIDATGWDCSLADDETATSESLDKFGFASSPCSNGYATIWESDAKRTEIQNNGKNDLKPGWCRVEGGNWTVGGAQFVAEEAHENLGGSIECV